MPVKNTGDSLSLDISGGAEVPGTFEFIGQQRIMFDARQDFISTHAPHSGHPVTAINECGDVSEYPRIAPFKEGWMSLVINEEWGPCSLAPYGSPGDTVDILAVKFKWVRLNDNGDVVWQTAMADISGFSLGDNVWAVAGNSTHVLFTKNLASSVYEFYAVDHTSDNGTFTVGPLITTITMSFSGTGLPEGGQVIVPKAHKMPGGWVMWAYRQNGASSTVTIHAFDDDFNFLGTTTAGTWNSTTENQRPRFERNWDGGPAFVQVLNRSTNALRIWDVTFDGTGPATISAPTTGTNVDKNTLTTGTQIRPVGNGMYDYDWSGPDDPMYWPKSDGSEATTTTNPYDWVFNDADSFVARMDGTVGVTMATVSDFENVTSPTGPYYGDAYGFIPHVYRHLFKNWDTGDDGWVDVVATLPDPGVVTHPWGTGYGDVDLDASGFSVINDTNGRVLFWTYTYWTIGNKFSDVGPNGGENRLTSYWIVQLGPAPITPPAAPTWVNFFNTGGVPDPDCPMLGSGENRAFLYDRGGARKIGEITDTTLIRWSRKRDDISTATVMVETPNPECARLLKEVAVGRHEVVIFRDGERMWEGPITRIGYEGGSVEIACEDVWYYTARTIMHNAYDNRYSKKKSKVGPVTHRAQIILATELARKERLSPSYNLLRFLDVRTHSKTTRTSRFTNAYDSSVWEEIDYMAAKLSLDYTAVGRRMLVNDVHDVIGRTEMLTDKDFSNPLIITVYGRELATRSAVTDGEGHWAAVGGIDPFYGEVELINTTYGEGVQPAAVTPTAEELRQLMSEMSSQAQRNLAGRYPVPTVVRVPDNTRVDPSAPVTIDDLIPGMRIPIRATQTVLVLEQEQKLDSVVVEQSSIGEQVSITLSPAPGTTPWDDSSETAADAVSA